MKRIFFVILFVSLLPSWLYAQEIAPSAAGKAESEAVKDGVLKKDEAKPLPVPAIGRSDILKFSQEKFESIKALNLSKASKERDEGLRVIVSGLVNFDKLAQRSLSKNWDLLSSEQQGEYKKLFKELVELTYVDKFKKHRMDEKYRVEWEGSKVKGDVATVGCFVKHKDTETEIEIGYRWVIERWEIQDVMLDGASLAESYQKKYDKMYNEKGYDGVVDAMRKEIKKYK